MIPALSVDAHHAARHCAAFLDRRIAGGSCVSGTDRASYLQGLLTQRDIVALKAGQGCYAAYLTAQGRMIADLDVYELGDVLLLAMSGGVKDAVMAKLDQFIFSEDVQLGDVTGHVRTQVALVSPDAGDSGGLSRQRCCRCGSRLLEDGRTRQRALTQLGRQPGRSSRASQTPAEPGFDVCVDRAHATAAFRSGALAAPAVVQLDDAERREAVPDRGRRAAVPSRPGRRDDSARSGHRVACHQLQQRLLCRSRGDHPRPALMTRPCRA